MNDIIINKTQSIQRCIKRAREELQNAGDSFDVDYTRQDAAVLNLTRACEQSIDLANHIVKTLKLGVPTDSRQSFDLLAKGGIIQHDLSETLKRMIGFRNTAVHEYQEVNMSIVKRIIVESSNDLIRFTEYAVRIQLPES